MKIAFIGIGALGGYFGGRLARAGNEVVFVARGATLEALRKNGLRVETPTGEIVLPHLNATGDPTSVGHVDAVFVTTKAWQVPQAAQQIRNMVGRKTIVIPLQNGVEAYDQLAAALGPEHVLGGDVSHHRHGGGAGRDPAHGLESADDYRRVEQYAHSAPRQVGGVPRGSRAGSSCPRKHPGRAVGEV